MLVYHFNSTECMYMYLILTSFTGFTIKITIQLYLHVHLINSECNRLFSYSTLGLLEYRKSSIMPPGGLISSSTFEGRLNREGGGGGLNKFSETQKNRGMRHSRLTRCTTEVTGKSI